MHKAQTLTPSPQYYPSIRSRFTSGPKIPFDFNLLRAHHPRQLIASAMVLLWAGRLGTFLFQVSQELSDAGGERKTQSAAGQEWLAGDPELRLARSSSMVE